MDLNRREWLRLLGMSAAGFLAACVTRSAEEETTERSEDALDESDASTSIDASVADASAVDAEAPFVILYDTHAQALYLDGTFGPKTGIIRVADIAASADKLYDFWHGHNNKLHRFTVTAAHFGELKKKKRVSITTTVVDNHQHTLFIDPVDTRWRVSGAQPAKVPL